jgi:RNA polymerase sigma-70 factor (ECF subfamily)
MSAVLGSTFSHATALRTVAVRLGGVRLPSEDTDEHLIAAYRAGDASAFDRVYLRHRGGVYRYVLRHVRNRAEADELHQDVWLRVVQARDTFDLGSSFGSWLYRIARNRVIDHWRRRRPQVSLDDDGADGGAPLLDALAAASTSEPLHANLAIEDKQRLERALGGLPPAQRDAFLLHVEGGLAIAEIATITSMPAEAIKSRLRYAYAKLRDAMEARP